MVEPQRKENANRSYIHNDIRCKDNCILCKPLHDSCSQEILIATGTPPGVGGGMKPQKFLKHGDEMHLGIEKTGRATPKSC